MNDTISRGIVYSQLRNVQTIYKEKYTYIKKKVKINIKLELSKIELKTLPYDIESQVAG